MSRANMVAVIPARGGSKGIPKKNLQTIAGRTLLRWAIDVAKEADIFSDIVVSTDDPEIQYEALRCGAQCPFLRPEALATDTAPTYPVVKHAVDYMEQARGTRYDYVMLLQPTAPFRVADDVRRSFEILTVAQAPSLVSLVRIDDPHPLKTHTINNNRVCTFVTGKKGVCHVRRQGLPEVYALNGAIYLSRREVLDASLLAEDVVPYIMPAERSVNIDTLADLTFAQYLRQS